MSARAVLISAPASGQGKTTITAALARRFQRIGQRVKIFKVGADFLDPLLLEQACGAPVDALDLWMVGEQECHSLLMEAAENSDIILIEGAMGLYDGDPSAADLARALSIPVAVVIDVGAMAQTVGALAQGLRDFGPTHLVGVIANGVAGPRHAEMVATALREIPLLGSMDRHDGGLPERQLGLVLPAEVEDLERRFEVSADHLELDDVAWRELPPWNASPTSLRSPAPPTPRLLDGRVVAVARDAAFAFFYAANARCLQTLGATIAWFSPLADEVVPAAADALILPGGYPELHGDALSRAQHFMRSMRDAHRRGLPILAECGGMMALTDALIDLDGRSWPMTGLLPGTTRMQPRLVGLGLQAWETGHGVIRGHTFHYSTLDTRVPEASRTVTHPMTAAGEAIYRLGSLTASYFHAYLPSSPRAAAALLGGEDIVQT
jgi:cobyrinic acid a,c-diamide synthase